jgi:hypothetical protein
MQVLVLIVQNAVEYADLGVATSGATLFRSVGGSLGTAVMGAVFSNRLSSELKSLIPASARSAGPSSASISPKAIAALPGPLRDGYLQAFTHALKTVFVVAAAVAVIAFIVSWFIRELPLRETVATGDLGDTFAAPRDTAALAAAINQIGRLGRRQGAREIVRRVAERAGVQLSPAACWLLARVSEDAPAHLDELEQRARIPSRALHDAWTQLRERGLIEPHPPGSEHYVLSGTGRQTLELLTSTGEQRLAALLEGWRPEEHEELARMIAVIAREFFIDTAALLAHLPSEPLPAPA